MHIMATITGAALGTVIGCIVGFVIFPMVVDCIARVVRKLVDMCKRS